MGRMNEQTKRTQSMHGKTADAKTPEERRKLMDQHRKSMQDSIAMMNQMMQGEGMMDGMMGRKGTSPTRMRKGGWCRNAGI